MHVVDACAEIHITLKPIEPLSPTGEAKILIRSGAVAQGSEGAPVTRLEVVSFDAAGTLFGVAEPVAKTYARHAAQFGWMCSLSGSSPDSVRPIAGMPPMVFGTVDPFERRDLEKQWWRHLVQRVFGMDQTEVGFDACFEALYAHYERGDAWRVYPEVRGLLEALCAAGYRLTVTSTSTPVWNRSSIA